MKETFSHEFNNWQRFLQKTLGMWRINRESIDFRWGYFAPRFGLQFYVNRGGYFDQRYSITFCLIWGMFDIKLPFRTRLEASCENPRYGFAVHDDMFWIYTGHKRSPYGDIQSSWKAWNLPWFHFVFDIRKAIYKDGSWGLGGYKYEEYFHKEQYPYKYVLRNGEVQNTVATCHIEKFQWHRKWFPFFKKVRTFLEIKFANEVGERAGSWKGGCTGCSYDMLKGETMEQCLRRMESERKFR